MTRATELEESAVVQILLDRESSHEALAYCLGCPAETVRDTRYGKRFANIRPDIPRWTGKLKRARPTEQQIIGVLRAYDLNNSQAGRQFDMNYATVAQIRQGKIYKDVRPDIPRWEPGQGSTRQSHAGTQTASSNIPRSGFNPSCIHYQKPTPLPWPFSEDIQHNPCTLGFPDACPQDCASYIRRQ